MSYNELKERAAYELSKCCTNNNVIIRYDGSGYAHDLELDGDPAFIYDETDNNVIYNDNGTHTATFTPPYFILSLKEYKHAAIIFMFNNAIVLFRTAEQLINTLEAYGTDHRKHININKLSEGVQELTINNTPAQDITLNDNATIIRL